MTVEQIIEGVFERCLAKSEARIADRVIQAIASRAEQLEELHVILSCSRDAASARIRRTSALRACGIQIGPRRILFRRSDVLRVLAETARAPRLAAGGK